LLFVVILLPFQIIALYMNIKLPENGYKILFEDNDVQIIIGIDKQILIG